MIYTVSFLKQTNKHRCPVNDDHGCPVNDDHDFSATHTGLL